MPFVSVSVFYCLTDIDTDPSRYNLFKYEDHFFVVLYTICHCFIDVFSQLGLEIFEILKNILF